MGYVSHPWSLTICVMVINVAALVTARHYMDAMTEDHLEARDVNTDDLHLTERSSTGSIRDRKRHRRDVEGFFKIRVTVGSLPDSVARKGRVYLKVLYESGDDWGDFAFIGNNFWSGPNGPVEKSNVTYYYDSDYERISKILVKNVRGEPFYPAKIEIDTPGVCQRYVCDWGAQCGEDGCPKTSPIEPLCSCYITTNTVREIDCTNVSNC